MQDVPPLSEVLQCEAEYYYTHGIKSLERRSYGQAIKSLRVVLDRTTGTSDTHYYLALAMLRGKRPRLLSLSTIRAVEEHLRVAIELDPQCGHAHILWALLKYDYYVMNGMFDRPPTVEQLLSRNWSVSQEQVREILAHIKAPGNQVWGKLRALQE